MSGISNSRKLDDIRVHLKQIVSADDARKQGRDGETPAAAQARRSGVLPLPIRAQVEAVLVEAVEHAPIMGEAQTAKFSASRAAKAALALGRQALARVDSHLQAVTREREPLVGRNYGVYGVNPKGMAAVARALFQCQVENARIKALPPAPADQVEDAAMVLQRALVFTPVVEATVDEALAALESLVGGRLSTRAELSRKVVVKAELIDRALACIGAVRNHLYANLPLRRRDPDLRDYGFRPVKRPSAKSEGEGQGMALGNAVVAAAAVGNGNLGAGPGPATSPSSGPVSVR